jgi:beta-galactosidase
MEELTLNKQAHIYYGADYNPEQWSEDVWLEDMRLMKKAGVNLVSVGIFSWAALQPNPVSYDFDWMDRLMSLLAENGIGADLATATASPPAWMATKYPDTLPVDKNGVRMSHGSRQHYCPNSPIFREYAAKLVTLLASRYKDHPALQMWHINNEYACHVQACYCEQCAKAFRVWLEKRYSTIDELNLRWGTNFWSQKYYSWDEIVPPARTPTYPNPGQTLDYHRFMSDSLLECYLAEYHILKSATPEIPVMTNFMGDFKPLDYFKWAEHVDVVTWDSYPDPKGGPVYAARNHDLMRSLRQGQPFILMEQVTSQVNWRQQNPMKRPGVMRLWSYQTVAHGGDGVMFFQWRQSQAGAEKFHAGMVPYTGDENSRVYREVEQLGNELKRLDAIVGSSYPADIAVLFDYESWWALELPSKPSMDVRYIRQVEQYYRPLFERNLAVDFARPTDDLSKYKLVIAPALYMLRPGVADNLERYVSGGGTLVTSFFSGIVDENDRLNAGGYGAPLWKLLGLAVEEVDPMLPGETNGLHVDTAVGSGDRALAGEYTCDLWADLIRLEGASALAAFTGEFYADQAAVTEHRFGQGRAVYVGTQAEPRFLDGLLAQLADDAGVRAPLDAPQGVEAVVREKDGRRFLFLLNHNKNSVQVDLPAGTHRDLLTDASSSGKVELSAAGVMILELAQ